MSNDLARMRHDYETAGLDVSDLHANPLTQFERWFDEAVAAELPEPNAMVVSTVDADGAPHSRHLLLKGVSDGGFEFYTNYRSAKGHQLGGDDRAALTFAWLGLHRQVNIAGRVEMLSNALSDAYFALRPRGAQLGAWASDQSQTLEDRRELTDRLAEVEGRFPDDVPRPPHWGGYRVIPQSIEFWQGRPSRLHDRLRYDREGDEWVVRRLAP